MAILLEGGLLLVNKRKLLLFLLLALTFAGQMSTLSKGPLIALLVGSGTVVALTSSWRRWPIRCAMAILGLLLAGFCISRASDLITSLSFLSQRAMKVSAEESSLGYRFKLWRRGTRQVISTQGMGCGLGGMKRYLPDAPHPHNAYLATLFDFGFPGLWLWLWLLWEGLRRPWKVRERVPISLRPLLVAYLGGYLCLAVDMLANYPYTVPLPWLYLGIGAAFCSLETRTGK